MTWYSASIITVIKSIDGQQDVFPVFEDVYLIEAEDRLAAEKKAAAIGSALQNIADKLELCGKPAKREFIGIRKIRSIYNPTEINLDEVPPVDGTELTHSFFEIRTQEDLHKFAMGKRVIVDYVDDDQ